MKNFIKFSFPSSKVSDRIQSKSTNISSMMLSKIYVTKSERNSRPYDENLIFHQNQSSNRDQHHPVFQQIQITTTISQTPTITSWTHKSAVHDYDIHVVHDATIGKLQIPDPILTSIHTEMMTTIPFLLDHPKNQLHSTLPSRTAQTTRATPTIPIPMKCIQHNPTSLPTHK